MHRSIQEWWLYAHWRSGQLAQDVGLRGSEDGTLLLLGFHWSYLSACQHNVQSLGQRYGDLSC